MSEYFSIAALLIMFREALEASVIIAVLLQMLNKMQMTNLKRWVWFGALLGVAISVVIGIIFVLVFYLANTKLMSSEASLIFKGCICWLAAILITVVAFAMLKFYNLERKWKRKLESEFSREKASKNYKWSMFLLAGSATLREGMESVLFLTGTSAGLSVKSVIIPGIVGIIAGSLLGVIVYYSGHSIKSLKWFFIVSAGLLMFIAAGMVINGTAFFTGAGLFGVLYPYEWRPWSNLIVWDATSCCNPDTNQGWALLRALFGWQAAPTNLCGDFDSFKKSDESVGLDTQPSEKESTIKSASDMESGSDSRAGSEDNVGAERLSTDDNSSSSLDKSTSTKNEEKKSFVENSKAWWHSTVDSVFKRSKAPASAPQEPN
eukprot:jgi/Picre1/32212/NNA_007558.t1